MKLFNNSLLISLSLNLYLQNDILEYAMQGDTCQQNAIKFKRIVAVALNVNENDVDTNRDLTDEVEHFTDNQFTWIEADLRRSQTPEKVQRSMKFLRTIRNGMTNDQIFGRDTVI